MKKVVLRNLASVWTMVRSLFLLWALSFFSGVQAQAVDSVLLIPPSPQGRELEMQVEVDRRRMASLKQRLDFITRMPSDSAACLPDNIAIEGTALDFTANRYRTPGRLQQDVGHLAVLGYAPVVMELVECWPLDSVRVAYEAGGRRFRATAFGEVLSMLTGGRLRAGEALLYGSPGFEDYNGLVPYYYEGKNCYLLWDDDGVRRVFRRMPGFRRANGVAPFYSLPYNFKGIRQVALCRYSPECYVLLLLTTPMEEMD